MRFATALLALLCAIGCATPADPLGHRGELETAQKRYTSLIRWRDTEKAAVFVLPERREAFIELAKQLETVEISDYEIGEIEWGEDDMTASVRVTYHGYSLSHLIEHKVRVTQEWKRDGDNDWRIDPDLARVVAQLRGEAPE